METRKIDDLRLKTLRIVAQKRAEKTKLKIHADPNSLPFQKSSRQSVLQMWLTQAPAVGCSLTSFFIVLHSGLCTCRPHRPGSSPCPGQAGLIPTSGLCLCSPLHLKHPSYPGLHSRGFGSAAAGATLISVPHCRVLGTRGVEGVSNG